MSDPHKPSSSRSSEDPWEQLAEDLFGLEYGKEHAAREAEPTAAPAQISSVTPAEQPIARRAEEPVVHERESIPEPALETEAAAESAEFAFDDAAEVSESTESAPAEPLRTEPVSPQDSYWDALANWNWDESEGGAGKGRPAPARSSERPPPRGGRGRDERGREDRGRRGGERPQRQAPAAAPARPETPRPSRESGPSATDDFGLGVTSSEERISEPAGETRPEPAPTRERREQPETARSREMPASGERVERGPPSEGAHGHREERGGDDGHRKRRRRRRRRRSRGETPGAPGAAGAADSAVPGADWEDEAAASEPESTSAEAGEEEEFERERLPDQPQRRERDRSSEQRHAPANDFEEPFEDDEDHHEVAAAGGEQDETDLGDEESEEQTVGYDNVPTWEEAISYLLHPSQVQLEGGGGGGSPPPRSAPGDQPRQTRHVGHRKHRR